MGHHAVVIGHKSPCSTGFLPKNQPLVEDCAILFTGDIKIKITPPLLEMINGKIVC